MNVADNEQPPLVLIVDDEATNLQLAGSIIQKEGLEVAFAKSGYKAITMVEADQPDLILLDVMMPGMDGFKVCERLKRSAQFKDIPIIFLTAKTETEDIVKGFEMGACDYVLKPFRSGELLARVRTQIALRRATQKQTKMLGELETANLELKRQQNTILDQTKKIRLANEELTQRNDALQMLSESKSEILSMASHDLRNPISAICGIANLLRIRLDGVEPPPLSQGNADLGLDTVDEMIGTIEQSGSHMLKILSEMLDNEALESGKINLRTCNCNLAHLAREVVTFNRERASHKLIEIKLECEGEAIGDFDISRMREVLDNLLSNAIKYSEPNTQISIKVDRGGPHPLLNRIIIQDQGPGFTEDDQQKLFQRFTKLSARPTGGEMSTGLGLSIVKKLIDLHKGEVKLESEAGKGATFFIHLPAPG